MLSTDNAGDFNAARVQLIRLIHLVFQVFQVVVSSVVLECGCDGAGDTCVVLYPSNI